MIYTILQFSLAASVGLWLKYSYLTAPLVIAGISAAVWRYGGSVHAATLLPIFMLGVSVIVLVGLWRAGVSDFHLLVGLLPYSDAQGYYTDALRLLHGQRLSVFSSRRPLFPAFLAAVLGATGLDLRIALFLLTAMSVLAICFAVREVQRSLGVPAGILMLLCLFMFYRRYIGSTLTEHLGLTFGCLAFSLIWRGTVLRRSGPVLFGLFLLSLALNARAGAFLILPAILLWAVLTFRAPKDFGLRTLAGGVAAVLLGFAVNGLLLHAVGISGAAYSNFSYTLYGLVSGGNWSLALQQHPELAALAPLEQAERVYALAWKEIRTNPLALFAGSARAWTAFFLGRSGTWFSHILYLSPEWADLRGMLLAAGVKAVNFRRDLWVLLDVVGREGWIIGLNVLMVAGAVMLWRTRRQPPARLILAAWAGILLSVPFVPPWDADNMRAYAATLPFVIAMPVMGLSYRRQGELRWGTGDAGGRSYRSTAVWSFSAILLALQPVGPLIGMAGGLARSVPGPVQPCAAGCRDAGQMRLVSLDPRSAIHLGDSHQGVETHRAGNSLSLSQLRERKHIKDYPDVWHMWRSLSRLPAGTTLALAYDIRRGDTVYVQSVSTAFPESHGIVSVCGEVIRHGWIEWFRIDSLGECQRVNTAALQGALQ
jgi:hypothetical protein